MRQTDLIASFRKIALAHSTKTNRYGRDFTHRFLRDHKMSLANPTPTETQHTQASKVSTTQNKSAKGTALVLIQQRYNKIQVIYELAFQAGLHRNHFDMVLDELGILIHRDLSTDAVGKFLLRGLVKITTSSHPAQEVSVGESASASGGYHTGMK
jgi:hypothetical protein